MFRSYRGLVFTAIGLAITALLLWFLITDLSTVDKAYKHSAAGASDYYSSYADQQIRKNCLSPAGLKEPECAEKQREAAREAQRKEEELAAQNITAWWTKVMGVAALIGMTLSAIGVGLVFITFQATQRAAQAALEANAISRNADRAQNEASLIVAGFAFRYSRNMPHEKDICAFDFAVTNMGKTQALKANCKMMAIIREKNEDEIWQQSDIIGVIKNVNPLFQETMEIDIKSVESIYDHHDIIANGKCTMFVHIILSYDTEYNDTIEKTLKTSFDIINDTNAHNCFRFIIERGWVRFASESVRTCKSTQPHH